MTHDDLVPHAVCWAASPRLIWTMVAANTIIFLSYASNCSTLLYIAHRTRRVLVRDWIWFIVGFAVFIVACGSTHLLDVITTWIPVFWIDAWLTILTAIASAYVAFMLARRAGPISFAINDYAQRLGDTEREKRHLGDKLLAARKLEDWSRMSAVISHEISNPLEAIQNILHLITNDEKVSTQTVRLARMATEEVGRVITISRSTLSFHRESATPEQVNLFSVAESVRFLLQGAIEQRQINFQITSEGDVTVEAYPGETRQVLLNLARNACEATSAPGSTVLLHLAGSAQGVNLTVTDQGSGVPAARVATLFDFGNTTKGEHGNGMGLWTVKQIVSRHGGSVRLDSEYRTGARFVVWWPREYSPASALEDAAATAS